MEKLYQKFKDIAEFRIVYIREAHPVDGNRPSPQARRNEINQPKQLDQRCAIAKLLVNEGKLNIPCVIDTMNNKTDAAYSAKPDRAFLVDLDGKIAVAGGRGPRGFKPALNEIEEWLQNFNKSGKDD